MAEISYTPVPCICKGIIQERTTLEDEANMYPVYIYDSPMGEIHRILTKLAYSPSTEQNIRIGDHVMCLIVFQWCSEGHYVGVVQEATHMIQGKYKPVEISKTDINNPNADLVGVSTSFVDERNQCGMIVEDSGGVRVVTNGHVKASYSPGGHGVNENLQRTFAQNHTRVVAHDPPYYRAREHFGLFNGNDLDEKISNASDPSSMSIIYRRFVPQNRDLSNWVSTNEGTWMPWVGTNNDSTQIKNTRDILYNKIINYGQSRITVHAGEPDEGFFTFRIDIVDLQPLGGERRRQNGGGVTPVSAKKSFYLGISPEGELKAEMAIKSTAGSYKPAAKLEITKDGEVNWEVGKSFKINGKELLTKDFLTFMTKHQLDLVQTVALGAPAPMSPAATPDFKAGQEDGNFLTNAESNDLESSAPDLKST